ncbi:hypothetical protein GCM10011492_06240 [Flexivirga endophytica]|uniref:Uncharacterized protein n=1 Tax=Flexivirga endophytica TaxID=1849103 RepID=A0A916WNE9_9MICO|nr:hypothetical protein GCM10011492_06240 [Flexivirga endophytica]
MNAEPQLTPPFVIPPNPRNNPKLAALYDEGVLRPVVERTFDFADTIDAMAYVEQGRRHGGQHHRGGSRSRL